VKALAVLLVVVAASWLGLGAMFAFMARMERQGLTWGSNDAAQQVARRQQRWAGKAASVMYRRLWCVPAIAVVGFVVIAVNYRI
jgi:hypothetical protein